MSEEIWTMRRTWSADRDDDWLVCRNHEPIGRIYHLPHQPSAEWSWSMTIPHPIPAYCNGYAETLDKAKAEWMAAWRLWRAAELTDAELEAALTIARATRERMARWTREHGRE